MGAFTYFHNVQFNSDSVGKQNEYYVEYTPNEDAVPIVVNGASIWGTRNIKQAEQYMQDPVICYGLRADFKGDLFPGSEALLVMADKIEEVKTICWCGKKATFNARFDAAGKVLKEGEQVVLGANDQYIGLCRKHWMAGDLGPDFRPEDLL